MDRYHWTVLPQGMKNSPTICQVYVAEAICPVRLRFPEMYIYHYMDDILLASSTNNQVQEALPVLRSVLQNRGLQIAPEKIQMEAPWKYLGWKILQQTVQPQNVAISTDIKTLNDVQKLLGNINWIRTQCGLDNETLAPLFELLKGNTDLNAPRQWTTAAKDALRTLYVCNQEQQPLAIIGQWEARERDPLILLEWVFLPYQATKTLVTRIELFAALIKRGRERIVEMTGKEPELIILPVVKNYLNWCLQNSLELQMALAGFDGQIDTHHRPHKMFTFYNNVKIENKPLYQRQPVYGYHGKTGKAVITWKEKGQWQHQVERIEGSPQLVELHAITMAFRKWSLTPLNIVSDSQYAVGVVQRIERAQLKHVPKQALFLKFKELLFLIEQRRHPYSVIHVRSHTNLPGFLTEGNARADYLTNMALHTPVPHTLTQAQLSHQFFHQSVKVLAKQFAISVGDAKLIVKHCQQQPSGLSFMTNPRGLFSLQLWQTDVTHILEFGQQKYVHVSIDTYSHVVWATAMTDENSRHVQSHFRAAFAALGIPREIKTDNGSAYVSHTTCRFFHTWGISHKTGIPHSPTGQAIIERTHRTLKTLLQKQKKGEAQESPQNRLGKALYVMNHLSLPFQHEDIPPIVKHYKAMESGLTPISQEKAMVMMKNLNTGCWEGPYQLITWG
ncbi:LOW QUALITY PROTEIN: hypothetical protein QYF61_023007 [Mycteria americana]|uniref:Uncharacterized protein n=1 Tax=Mycteria americana TaxID=33587 RepID=A0AAN7RX48_MYCAM|nr:LOW QUALITY PROTEIN: hypothetical protein QYF61_023007 [Mycteria americana]